MDDQRYKMARTLRKVIDCYKLYQKNDKLSANIIFFDLYAKCQLINPELFIEYDLENINSKRILYDVLLNYWTNSFSNWWYENRIDYSLVYNTILSLFSKEDFMQVFPSSIEVLHAIYTLKHSEHTICGDDFSWNREKFETLYDVIENRLEISLKH